jgi:hypothetical protein
VVSDALNAASASSVAIANSPLYRWSGSGGVPPAGSVMNIIIRKAGPVGCGLLAACLVACGGAADHQGADDALGGHAGALNASGGSSTGGSSGEAGGTDIPPSNNLYISEIRTPVNKLDLLFMIDNSISMADKQAVLADAISSLLLRLVTPNCVTSMGIPTGASADANGSCDVGTAEFPPLRDIHIGVVSSSLGAHGGQTCADVPGDDRGQLIPLVRQDAMYPVQTWNDTSGFLYWDPGAKATPPGLSNLPELQTEFRNMVLAVGQTGCGFESSLEGWYRFLVDPQPLISTPQVSDGSVTKPVYNSDVDSNPVLKQRALFLRPDSIVAVVMLSDENDCSIIDSGQGWLVGTQTFNGQVFRFPRSTSACDTNPNDPCCSSCLASTWESSCSRPSDDAACKQGSYLTPAEDSLNLRCYRQKERFGIDLLYPIERYVDGLSKPQITNRDGEIVQNPLFASPTGIPRDPGMVYLAGIVGVPWQDLVVDADASVIEYMNYADIDWSLLLGLPGDTKTPPSPPGDKLMYETVQDRSTLFGPAQHPVIGALGALAPASSPGRPNAINGHESNIERNDDLQYACIFPLPQPRSNCTGAGCDCDSDGQSYNRPLCDGSTQVYAKAYPGVRELQVLQGYGAIGRGNSIVASICPKTLSGSKADPNYGYNPAVSALVDRLKEGLTPRCLPRVLPVDPTTGRVPCSIVESSPLPDGRACQCDASAGRREPAAATLSSVLRDLRSIGYCGGPASPPCEEMCVCEIEQYADEDLRVCQTARSVPASMPPGFCYVDPLHSSDPNNSGEAAALVAHCPVSQRQLLRFIGADTPAIGATTMIACTATAL